MKKNQSLLSYFKSRIRRNRFLESVLFFIYTRFTFTYRSLQAKTISFLIKLIRKLVVRKDIEGIIIQNDSTQVKIVGSGKLHWDPGDRMSILGLALTGEWEHDDTQYLKKIIKSGQRVIDVGAYDGFHTILFSKLVGEKGRVYAFEPLKSMYKELEENISLNNIQGNTVLLKYALGENAGKFKIYVPERMGKGAASLSKRGISVEEEICEVITLDSYVKKEKIAKIDFIKCDIEGAELMAFRGAKNVLKNHRPSLMVEVTRGSSAAFGYTPEILLDFLEGFGYDFFFIYQGKLSKITESILPYFHGNCFAIPK